MLPAPLSQSIIPTPVQAMFLTPLPQWSTPAQAAQGRVPDSIGYEQIWRALVEIHQGGTAHAGSPAVTATAGAGSSPSDAASPTAPTVAASSPGAALLGYLHSLGYVKGLLNSLGCGEETRVLALARHAVLALTETRRAAGHPATGAIAAPPHSRAAAPTTLTGVGSKEELSALTHLLDPPIPPLWLVVMRVKGLFLLLWLLWLVVGVAKRASGFWSAHREELAVIALGLLSLAASAAFASWHTSTGAIA